MLTLLLIILVFIIAVFIFIAKTLKETISRLKAVNETVNSLYFHLTPLGKRLMRENKAKEKFCLKSDNRIKFKTSNDCFNYYIAYSLGGQSEETFKKKDIKKFFDKI